MIRGGPDDPAPDDRASSWVITLAELPLEPSLRAAFATVYADGFGSWSEDYVAHLEASLGSECLLAWDGDQLIGFKWSTARRPGEIHSNLGCVRRSHRGRGVARALTRRQHERIRAAGFDKVTTSTFHDNLPMLLLNVSMGFEVVGLSSSSKGPKLKLECRFDVESPEPRSSEPPKRLTLSDAWEVEVFAAPLPAGVRRQVAFLYAEVFEEPFDVFFGFLDQAMDSHCWVVREGGRVVGFKWGAARSVREFHSHVGAVDPAVRRQGVARGLLRAMLAWTSGRYPRLSTATFSRFRGMLLLDLKEGFRIDGLVQRGDKPMLLLSTVVDPSSR